MLSEEQKLRQELAVVWGMHDNLKSACAERDARIAELERLRSEDHSHALDLAAEIERMTQQLQAYEKHGVTCQTFRHFVSEPCAECNSPGRCAKQLEQQLAEARKDADRYQWLCGFSSVSMPELTWGRRAGIPKNKLDAAIDAAIKEQT